MSKEKDWKEKLYQQMEGKVKVISEEFYPNGSLADISFSSDTSILTSISAKAQASGALEQQSMTQEQMKEHCVRIRENAKEGKTGNYEIQFDRMAQIFLGKKYELGNTICKIRTYTGDVSPTFLFFKKDSSLGVRLFIGGEKAISIMAVRGEKDDDYFIRLSEFHMISIQENPDPRREIGLVTSYVWLTARVYSSVVFASTLDPIKSLLLSDWIQTEWEKAQNTGEQSSEELPGGDANG